MHDPIRMIFISLVSSLILGAGMAFYYYIYPKKKLNLLVLLMLISLLPLVSLLRPGTYESGDFNIHIYRAIEFYRSLTEGHIMPSWAGELNANYGLPLFIFNYPLPYYIVSFFHFFGFSFITSMKIFLATAFLLSGIFMYLSAKKLFKNSIAAFVTAVYYQFVPYHLVDLHFKVAIGEILTFTTLPLVFYFLQNLWNKKTGISFAFASLSVALLIMSHVSVALFSMALILCYVMFLSINSKKKHIIFYTIASFILGSIASLYVWLTPFFLTKYTIVPKMSFSVNFPKFWELLFSPWRMGLLFQGHNGEISVLLGYSQILVIIGIAILLIYNRIFITYRNAVRFWLIAFIILIFFMTYYSKPLWEAVPFLNTTGGVHRLLLPTAFVTSILGGYLSMHYLKKRILLWTLILFTIFSTILNWGHRRIIPEINDQNLIENLWASTYQADGHYFANSKFRSIKDPWFSKLPAAHLEAKKGSAEIKELQRDSTAHTYIVYAKTLVTLRENTLYFPGWQIYANNKPISINHDKDGVIIFNLPKGLHYIQVRYDDIIIYKVLKALSIAGFTGIFILIFFYREKLIKKKSSYR